MANDYSVDPEAPLYSNRAAATVTVSLRADSGYSSDETHRVSPAQWEAICRILNDTAAEAPPTLDIPKRLSTHHPMRKLRPAPDIPEYPSRSFQHEGGRRAVPWGDWQEMRAIAVAWKQQRDALHLELENLKAGMAGNA